MSSEFATNVEIELVRVGTRVRLRDDEGEEEFAIVRPDEADYSAGLVSSSSPIGVAVLGHAVGDEVVVGTPAGRRPVRIVAISAPGSDVWP
jgi:transcription elongation factor GreA